MKPVDFSRFFNPLHVLIAGLLGVGIILFLFSSYFPLSCRGGGTPFFCVPGFFVVFFLMTILWCMITILFIPGLGIFIWLFKRYVAKKGNHYLSSAIVQLLVVVILLVGSTVLVQGSLTRIYPEAQSQWNLDVPAGVQRIININSASLFLVFLPYILGMFLVYSVVREVSLTIQDTTEFKNSLSFAVIDDLRTYRKMLQVLLVVCGVLLSMIPLIVVAIRSVLITIDPKFGAIFPVTYVIFQGLSFTLLLLFIYFPIYLELAIAGQNVRDILCPLDSVDNLKNTLEKRKAVDDLLQTEINFATNLKSGILTLGPLISSLFVLLGIKL
jgi:hypothetical protein